MAYDLNRCPQNEDELREYFYTLIGRTPGTGANDWYDVLLKRYDWKGTLMMIPRGVGPGIKQKPDAPFFGLTQQMGTQGNPQARVFMPTDKPDGLNYYTQQVQYIEGSEGNFVWSWTHWNETGNPYAPVTGPGTVDPPVEPPTLPPPTGDYVTREEMNRAIAIAVSQCLRRGDQIGLRTQPWDDNPSKQVCADLEHRDTPLLANRDGQGTWETFTIT